MQATYKQIDCPKNITSGAIQHASKTSHSSRTSQAQGEILQESVFYAKVASTLPPANNVSLVQSQQTRPPWDDIRVSNVVHFGLPEGTSIFESRAVVDEMFEFMADRPVTIKDIFRLGNSDNLHNLVLCL